MAAFTGTERSYKLNDPRGNTTSSQFLHTGDIEIRRMKWEDDFLEGSNVLASTTFSKAYWTAGGTNGTATVTAGANGTMVLSTTSTGSRSASLAFAAADFSVVQQPSMEARLNLSAITNVTAGFWGFYASANDYVGFAFRSATSATKILCVAKSNGGTEVVLNTQITLGAGTNHKFGIDIINLSTPIIRLYVDDQEIQYFTGAVRALATMYPYFIIDNAAAAQENTMVIDYVKISQDRV